MSTRQFGIALAIFGALVLLGAAFAYTYQEIGEEFVPGYNEGGVQVSEPHYRSLTTTPYRNNAFPLILGSVALFFSGFAILLGGKIHHWSGFGGGQSRNTSKFESAAS